MDSAQQIVANNDRMFRELFGDAFEAEAELRHKSLAAGVCTCGQEPTEEEVAASRCASIYQNYYPQGES